MKIMRYKFMVNKFKLLKFFKLKLLIYYQDAFAPITPKTKFSLEMVRFQ